MPIIEINNLSYSYGSQVVLKQLNLTVNHGDFVMIRGGNGSGKTTLLKLILGELKKQTGSIKLNGETISEINDFREIGYVPQIQVADQISFPVTCLEFVMMNLYQQFGFFKIPDKKAKEQGVNILNDMGLGKYIHTPVNELSGGLKQRTMIARALINNPTCLILDEPTAGVDVESKKQFGKLLRKMSEDKELTIVLVTHEFDFVKEELKEPQLYEIAGGELTHVRI